MAKEGAAPVTLSERVVNDMMVEEQRKYIAEERAIYKLIETLVKEYEPCDASMKAFCSYVCVYFTKLLKQQNVVFMVNHQLELEALLDSVRLDNGTSLRQEDMPLDERFLRVPNVDHMDRRLWSPEKELMRIEEAGIGTYSFASIDSIVRELGDLSQLCTKLEVIRDRIRALESHKFDSNERCRHVIENNHMQLKQKQHLKEVLSRYKLPEGLGRVDGHSQSNAEDQAEDLMEGESDNRLVIDEPAAGEEPPSTASVAQEQPCDAIKSRPGQSGVQRPLYIPIVPVPETRFSRTQKMTGPRGPLFPVPR